MLSDLRATAAYPEDQVGPRMHRRKPRYPDVLEQTQDGELALLVDQGIVGENREVENQVRIPGWT